MSLDVTYLFKRKCVTGGGQNSFSFCVQISTAVEKPVVLPPPTGLECGALVGLEALSKHAKQ